MRDERLRRLARHAARSADPVERAAWLVERLRAGRLRPELLELAALSGDESAGLALPAPVVPLELGSLVEELLARAPRLAPRVALAAFRRSAPTTFCDDHELEVVVSAAEECLRRPTARTAEAAVRAAERAPSGHVLLRRVWRRSWYHRWEEEDACRVVLALPLEAARGAASLALARRYGPPDHEAVRALGGIGDALHTPDAAELLVHVRATVVGLALA